MSAQLFSPNQKKCGKHQDDLKCRVFALLASLLWFGVFSLAVTFADDDLPMRIWTSADGKSEAKASFVRMTKDGKSVILKKENGKEIQKKITDFHQDDQDYIQYQVSLMGENSVGNETNGSNDSQTEGASEEAQTANLSPEEALLQQLISQIKGDITDDADQQLLGDYLQHSDFSCDMQGESLIIQWIVDVSQKNKNGAAYTFPGDISGEKIHLDYAVEIVISPKNKTISGKIDFEVFSYKVWDEVHQDQVRVHCDAIKNNSYFPNNPWEEPRHSKRNLFRKMLLFSRYYRSRDH